MDALQVDGGRWAHPMLVASTVAELVAPVMTPEISPFPGRGIVSVGVTRTGEA